MGVGGFENVSFLGGSLCCGKIRLDDRCGSLAGGEGTDRVDLHPRYLGRQEASVSFVSKLGQIGLKWDKSIVTNIVH